MTPVVNLSELRLNRGLSITRAAQEMGISRETLERAESGERVPQPRNAFKIARFYEMRVTDIWPVEPVGTKAA